MQRVTRAPLARVRPDPEVRARAIEQTKQWIDRAAMLECPSIMPNQGTFPADPAPAIEALKTLRDYARSKGVDIILEPRGRSTVDTLVQVIKSGRYLRESGHRQFPR